MTIYCNFDYKTFDTAELGNTTKWAHCFPISAAGGLVSRPGKVLRVPNFKIILESRGTIIWDFLY